MPEPYDVLVIGAGPAGLAAARRASEAGARVAMVDDNPAPGGQIWRGTSPAVPPAAKLFCGALVVAAPAPNRLTFETFDSAFDLDYGALVVATGARERFLPFPGWTLPHVTGAGGLQALVKSGMPIAGKRVVVAGSGPLLLAVADYLRKRGAEVPLVAEQASGASVTRFGLTLLGHPGKLLQALQLRARFRYQTDCWPVSTEPHVGRAILPAAGFQPARPAGKRVGGQNWPPHIVTLRTPSRTFTERCDYLACAFGLVPNTELLSLLGNAPNVYPAGEVTGIGGLDLSIVEGEIAGLRAAGQDHAALALTPRLVRHQRFAAALDRAFALRPELAQLAAPETIVCRCEDATIGAIRRCSSWREAKLHTRCGMGACQGRVCGPAIEHLTGWQPDSVRPPLFPARIRTLSTPDAR
jgi:D-hydroxyproline dehydrogenase subunit alpha